VTPESNCKVEGVVDGYGVMVSWLEKLSVPVARVKIGPVSCLPERLRSIALLSCGPVATLSCA